MLSGGEWVSLFAAQVAALTGDRSSISRAVREGGRGGEGRRAWIVSTRLHRMRHLSLPLPPPRSWKRKTGLFLKSPKFIMRSRGGGREEVEVEEEEGRFMRSPSREIKNLTQPVPENGKKNLFLFCSSLSDWM